MSNPISARLRRWTPSDDGLHIIAADEIDRLVREIARLTTGFPPFPENGWHDSDSAEYAGK